MASPAQDEPASILIADDNADARRLLTLLLGREGYRLFLARDGQEALRIAERIPDLSAVILDVMMPGLDGLEVCRRLRARPTSRYLPIILATALSEEDQVAEGLAAGADDYVTKPIRQTELLARVRAALRLRRLTDELLEARETAAVGAMAVTLAHEINNPLTAVVGNLEFVLQRGSPTDKDRVRLEAAHAGALRIRDLVSRLTSIRKVVLTPYVNSVDMIDIERSSPAQQNAGPSAPPSPPSSGFLKG